MIFYKAHRKYFVFIIAFLSIFIFAYSSFELKAQSIGSNHKIDSLSNLINKHIKDDTLKVRWMNLLSNSYIKISPVKGIEVAEKKFGYK
jgi:hypothetical protein